MIESLGKRGQAGVQVFRHSAASIVDEQTGSLKQMQELLGHSTIKVTAEVCWHTSVEAEREAALAVEPAICGHSFAVAANIENSNSSVTVN